MEIVHTALWLSTEKILIINDLHIGYEEALHHKGILVPKFQLQEIIREMKLILSKVKPQKIIINGDLKHEFGTVLQQEWSEVLQFLDFCLQHCNEVIIIKGNHDPIIKPIAEKRGIRVVKEYQTGDTIIIHGDQLIGTNAKCIIIGHEHPAITLRKGSKREKYKCFLKGKWKEPGGGIGERIGGRIGKRAWKELIAVPSFNPLLEGTDVLKEKLLSPFLEQIADFEVYVVGKEDVFCFGKVEEVGKMIKLK
jgi:putative SbcD/Mre11-related phosphoesterase